MIGRCNASKCGKKKTEVEKSQKDGLLSTYSTNHKHCRTPREVLELQHEACALEELLLWPGSSEVWGGPGLGVPIQRPARFLASRFCLREWGGRNALKTSSLGTTVDCVPGVAGGLQPCVQGTSD